MSHHPSKPLQILARRMLPRFVHEEYPRFVEFVQGVLSYMDQEQHGYNVVANLLEYTDVDYTLPQFEEAFKKQYLRNFPETLAADVDLLVKTVREFYLNKGSEQSFRFLFAALYNSTVNFKYPKFNILRASDGLWFTPQYLVLTDGSDNIPPQLSGSDYDVVGLVDQFITGTQSGAVAFVDDTVILSQQGLTYGGSGNVKAIVVIEKEGAFQAGEQILIGDTLVENGDFSSGYSYWEPNVYDDGFIPENNQVRIQQITGSIFKRCLSQQVFTEQSSEYYIRYSLNSATAVESRITVGYAAGSAEIYDSGYITPGSVTTLLPLTGAGTTSIYITLWNESVVDGEYSVWDGISLVKKGSFNAPIMYIANIAAESGILDGPSQWKDKRGMLSEGDKANDQEIVLRDGNYYQDFSYELKSIVPTNQFESIIRDLVHPAGLKMFAAVLPADNLFSTYAIRGSYYTTINITGAQTITKSAADGWDFDQLFKPGELITLISEDTTDANAYVVARVSDTPNADTLTVKSTVNLAVENLSGTLVRINAGVYVNNDAPALEFEYVSAHMRDDSHNAILYQSNNLTFTNADPDTITDTQDFTAWVANGDTIQIIGSLSNDGTYLVDTVTATTITLDAGESLTTEAPSERFVTLQVLPNIDDNWEGVNIWPIIYDIEYINRQGYGLTYALAELRREANGVAIEDWSTLVIGDFDTKASERFGIIPSFEVEISP